MIDRLGTFQKGDACLVLVGLTAGWSKRRAVRRYIQSAIDVPVLVPWLPYPLGLSACAIWLSLYLRRHFGPTGYRSFHILAYIGGGFVLRKIVFDGQKVPIGRIVYDRGPIQERVPAILVQRNSRLLLTLIGGRTLVDLASGHYQELPLPSSEFGQGLIVETKASELAIRIGADGPFGTDLAAGLLPGASEVVAIPVSHDDVYTSPLFLEPAARFLATGSFAANPGKTTIR